MNKDSMCKICKKGNYVYGSALYDYYSCGHSFKKPLEYNHTKYVPETPTVSNAFDCLSALYKDQFNKSNLNKTHTFVIDEENETIWVRKK